MGEEIVRVDAIESTAMTPTSVMAQVHLIQAVMKEAMQLGEHYGVIPGCGKKPSLLKAGAEKLSLTFRLAPTYDVILRQLEHGHREYEVRCTLTHIPSGRLVGQGVGCCSTLESKYRYRAAERKCPACGKETIIKGREEFGGGWLCYAKKGGCGAKWPDGASEIEAQAVGRTDNPDIADVWNTVLKMAKKRAQVDATLTATAASDIFTQDLEDIPEPKADSPPPGKPTNEPAGVHPVQPTARHDQVAQAKADSAKVLDKKATPPLAKSAGDTEREHRAEIWEYCLDQAREDAENATHEVERLSKTPKGTTCSDLEKLSGQWLAATLGRMRAERDKK